MCFSPTCPIASNKMTIYCCKWHPTAFLRIFQTCSHPPDLFQSPYDISTRTGKPSYHLGVSSRYRGEEPKQSMWASSARISSTAHLYVGVLLAFQFYRDVLRKKRAHETICLLYRTHPQPLITPHATKSGTSDQRGLPAARPIQPTATLPRTLTRVGQQGGVYMHYISPVGQALRKPVPLRAQIHWPSISPLRA